MNYFFIIFYGSLIPTIALADTSDFQTYVSGFYTYGVGVAASLAVLMTVYGGYKYMTSQGNTDATQEAKTIIGSALAGLALLLLANLIFKSLFPDLLTLP